MDENDLQQLKNWFDGYVESYYTGDRIYDETIRIKQDHTKRVCEEIRLLSHSLVLSSGDTMIAETAALFHDIGRFEQYAKHKTFNDGRSENHAALGLRELEKHGILSHFEENEKRLICSAIGYHNRRLLPEDIDKKTLLFARLLRDADKLDIWKVMIDYYEGVLAGGDHTLVWGLPDKAVYSSEIIQALHRREMADVRYMKTLCDYKLVQISWVFDLNFAGSCRAVKKRKFIERIARTLPETEESREAIESAKTYLAERQTGTGKSDIA